MKPDKKLVIGTGNAEQISLSLKKWQRTEPLRRVVMAD